MNEILEKANSSIHFVGIGGVGMSAIAQVLLEKGHRISGSDLKLSPLTERLAAQGATIYEEHASAHLPAEAELVVVSSAVPEDNAEIVEAKRRRLPVVKRAVLLGRLMQQQYSVAVAGTHGKTTTTSLISLILEQAGMDPTILVGGDMIDLDRGAKLGYGRYLVAEADEFDGSLAFFSPSIAVVTNIEAEHLDYYGTEEAVIAAFHHFLASVPSDGYAVVCHDDPNLRRLLEEAKATPETDSSRPFLRIDRTVTYGLSEGSQWTATDLEPNYWGGFDFRGLYQGQDMGHFSLSIPGVHNITNALAAIAVCDLLGINHSIVKATITQFQGARRRFEVKGVVNDITIVDDYAHHPTEIQATLAAARQRFPKQHLIVVFQPHLYSRTKLLFDRFANSFGDADHVILADIYAAREEDPGDISSADLAKAITKPEAEYIGALESIASKLATELVPGDVLLTMGAGDVDTVADKVLAALR